jgi:NAD(P)-dependent dehydrogenase (short-subunit alcohol dehydrogenase family)
VDFCRVNCISPGFIETDILDIHPKEWREKWYSMVPAQRFADTYELKGVSFEVFFQVKCSSADLVTGLCVLCLGCVELYDGG